MARRSLWGVPAGCFAGGLIVGVLLSASWHGQAADTGAARQTPATSRPAAPPKDGKLRIICFGAHPDDCELKVGGTAALWAAQGHHVKLVSVTNGDIGHWRDAGGPLARRRAAEAAQADRILGVTSEVLDIHDGELLPSEPAKQQERRQSVRNGFANRSREVARRYRAALEPWYGKERADKVQSAEAFEVCEYGRRPNKEELARLFPFFGP